MADIPSNLKFLESHEWARVEEDGTVTVGISDHAQELLGDIVFVELPEVGKEISQSADIAIVESVKAAADVYAPATGVITEINTDLEDSPELVNESAYTEGWLFKMQPSDTSFESEWLSEDEYNKITDEN